MTLYEIMPDRIAPLSQTTFAGAGVRERADLQRLLREQVEIVSSDTLVVAEEFGEWEDSRRRIDLLGLDRHANLVVIELKRTEDGGHMELQGPSLRGDGLDHDFRAGRGDLRCLPPPIGA